MRFVALFFIFFLMACSTDKVASDKKLVAVSTFSLYDMTKFIAAKTLQVVNILPFGVDAHSYEPTPKEMAIIEKSALVIYSGAGLEPWTHGYSFKHKVIDMSKTVHLKELHEDMHEHEGGHHHEGLDPHYWLDFKNMQHSADLITEELIALLPKNKDLYIKNRDLYKQMLEELDTKFKTELSSCRLDTIVVNHNAFGYLADNYGFKVESLSGLSPDAEVDAKSMMRLIEHVNEHHVKTIFFESFVSDRAMKSIASEANVSVDVLQPLGNITADEADANLHYEEIMKKNLAKLKKALLCH